MKLYCLVFIILVLRCNCAVDAQNRYDAPAEAPIMNTYAPIDWGTLENARKLNVQVMRKKIINAYASYQHYPNIINDGWHNVVAVMPDAVIPHKAFVESNRIIKIVIQDNTINTDIEIVKGRCVSSELTIYFYEDIETYNK